MEGRPSARNFSSRLEGVASACGLLPPKPSAARCLLDLMPDVLRGCRSHILRGPPVKGWYVQSELRKELYRAAHASMLQDGLLVCAAAVALGSPFAGAAGCDAVRARKSGVAAPTKRFQVCAGSEPPVTPRMGL
jgi:hypothetical protein